MFAPFIFVIHNIDDAVPSGAQVLPIIIPFSYVIFYFASLRLYDVALIPFCPVNIFPVIFSCKISRSWFIS